MRYLFFLIAAGCINPTPVPCADCAMTKCNCGPDAGTPVVVTPAGPDAGAPVACNTCVCPSAAVAHQHVRHLENIPKHEHNAVCNKAIHCKAHVRSEGRKVKHFSTPSGFGPADLASAYKINTALNPGATIAIVDAYGYKNAESDLATYRSQYGLPACTVASGCLKIVNQAGKTSPLPPNPPSDDDWTVETALDLDLASAACPHCKILLVQANDDVSDGLYIANNTAATLGATVISNSWGGPESGQMTAYESYFNHAGIAIFVAAGDDGYDDGGQGPDYPSTSAFVTAVGGTSLVRATGTRGWAEVAWTSGGSSCSQSIHKPTWQTATTGCKFRAASDVSAVGDPSTGLAVYNKANEGWIVVGGTSAASPFVAGVYALTGHSMATGALPYTTPEAFFDVTSGTNGDCGAPLCKAGIGWDGPTGAGTPNGAVLGGAPAPCPAVCCK